MALANRRSFDFLTVLDKDNQFYTDNHIRKLFDCFIEMKNMKITPVLMNGIKPFDLNYHLKTFEDAIDKIEKMLTEKYQLSNLYAVGLKYPNLGALCGTESSLIVLVINNLEKWTELLTKEQGNVDTYSVTTFEGSIHYYFHHTFTSASLFKNKININDTKIDLINDGVVLCAGSKDPLTLREYTVRDDKDIQEMPKWLQQWIIKSEGLAIKRIPLRRNITVSENELNLIAECMTNANLDVRSFEYQDVSSNQLGLVLRYKLKVKSYKCHFHQNYHDTDPIIILLGPERKVYFDCQIGDLGGMYVGALRYSNELEELLNNSDAGASKVFIKMMGDTMAFPYASDREIYWFNDTSKLWYCYEKGYLLYHVIPLVLAPYANHLIEKNTRRIAQCKSDLSDVIMSGKNAGDRKKEECALLFKIKELEAYQKRLEGYKYNFETGTKIASLAKVIAGDFHCHTQEMYNNKFIELLDSSLDTLAIANGKLLDLTTGTTRLRTAEDFCAFAIAWDYNPSVDYSQLLKILDDIFLGNQNIIEFMQRFFGLCLSGNVCQFLYIFVGTGANGKSTLINILNKLLDKYLHHATREVFMDVGKPNGERASPHLIALRGKRVIVFSEIGEGEKLNEAQIKKLTGGEAMTARGLHCEQESFVPTFKSIILSNHKPLCSKDDKATWRRILLVPFEAHFTEEPVEPNDRKMVDMSDIINSDNFMQQVLRWSVEGSVKMNQDKANGKTFAEALRIPEEIKAATKAYQKEMDPFENFLRDCCTFGDNESVAASELYEAYKEYCKYQGYKCDNIKLFSKHLDERGFVKKKTNSCAIRLGITIVRDIDI